MTLNPSDQLSAPTEAARRRNPSSHQLRSNVQANVQAVNPRPLGDSQSSSTGLDVFTREGRPQNVQNVFLSEDCDPQSLAVQIPTAGNRTFERSPTMSAEPPEVPSGLETHNNAFTLAVTGTGGTSYVNVLRSFSDLFRSGHVGEELQDNLAMTHVTAIAEILKGVSFKPVINYTDLGIIETLHGNESTLDSFEVVINLDGMQHYGIDLKKIVIPPGTFCVTLAELNLQGDLDKVPDMPSSVKVIDFYNNDMAAGDLDYSRFVHVKTLKLTGNNFTNRQLAENLILPNNIESVSIDVAKAGSNRMLIKPSARTLRTLRTKYPKCDFDI